MIPTHLQHAPRSLSVSHVTFLASASWAGRWRRARHAALFVAALAVAHEAVYFVRYPDPAHAATAMSASGHDRYWLLFLVAATAAAVLLAAWVAWRLTGGVHAAAAERASREAGSDLLRHEWLAILRRVTPAVAAAFLVQENLEHAGAHGHFEGLNVYLGPGNELSLPALLAISALVAAGGALIRWRERLLIARLRARMPHHVARRRAELRSPRTWDITAALVRLRLLVARHDHDRAPPIACVA